MSDQIRDFLEADGERSAQARSELLSGGLDALGALVWKRWHTPNLTRLESLHDLIFDLKRATAGARGKPAFDKLEKERIVIDMQGAPLSAVIDYIREVTGLQFVTDPLCESGGMAVDVRFADVPVRTVLRFVFRRAEVEYEFRSGVIFIASPERLWPPPVESPRGEAGARASRKRGDLITRTALWRGQELGESSRRTIKKLESTRLDLSFRNSKPEDVLAYIRDFTGLNLIFETKVEPGNTVRTLSLKNHPTLDVLELLFFPMGYDIRMDDGILVGFKPKH